MFYGIVVMMYYYDNNQHHLPHIHVRYQGTEAIFGINDTKMLEGDLPNKQKKLVQAWMEIHKEYLASLNTAIDDMIKPYTFHSFFSWHSQYSS